MTKTLLLASAVALLATACNSPNPEPSPQQRKDSMPTVTPLRTRATAQLPGAATAAAEPAEPLPEPPAALLAPDKAKAKAPAEFKVKFVTTKGDFIVKAHRDWSPEGVDRFYNLVTIGFFTDIALFRAVDKFVVQFGIHGHPKVAAAWQNASIQDEPVKEGNKRARMVFAKGGPNSRTTQIFINYSDNSAGLDGMGFPAFAEVVEGMDVVDAFNKEYGDKPTSRQGEMTRLGNAWTRKQFPNLDFIKSAELVK